MVATKERSEFDSKPPLGAPLLIFPRGSLLKSFPQGDTSTRQRWFEIRYFLLLAYYCLPHFVVPRISLAFPTLVFSHTSSHTLKMSSLKHPKKLTTKNSAHSTTLSSNLFGIMSFLKSLSISLYASFSLLLLFSLICRFRHSHTL